MEMTCIDINIIKKFWIIEKSILHFIMLKTGIWIFAIHSFYLKLYCFYTIIYYKKCFLTS